MEDTARHTAIALNGGDDAFFQTTYMQKQWFAPFVDAAYGNAVFQAPGSFDVFATQDALIARPTGGTRKKSRCWLTVKLLCKSDCCGQ